MTSPVTTRGDQGQPSGKWAEYLLASRATTIYGGTTEIMKEIVGRSLGV